MINKYGVNLIFFLFIHLFYIIIDYGPSTVFSTEDIAGNKTNKNTG